MFEVLLVGQIDDPTFQRAITAAEWAKNQSHIDHLSDLIDRKERGEAEKEPAARMAASLASTCTGALSAAAKSLAGSSGE